MKKVFSVFLVFCAALAYADDQSDFDPADDTGCPHCMIAECTLDEETVFEPEENESILNAYTPYERIYGTSIFDETQENSFDASYLRWNRYKSNFGMEKVIIRFPASPTVSKSTSLLTAYAYDGPVIYSFTGYLPALGNIISSIWFEQLLYTMSSYPYTLTNHSIYQESSGYWVLDYTAHDYVQNLIVKAKVIVTPFNSYTLQCVKPNATSDYFDYFVDNFSIRCECN